jgi:hypothetical protein
MASVVTEEPADALIPLAAGLRSVVVSLLPSCGNSYHPAEAEGKPRPLRTSMERTRRAWSVGILERPTAEGVKVQIAEQSTRVIERRAVRWT